MLLMKEFNGCASQAQQRAAAMRSEIHTLEEIDERSQEQQAQERAAEDARIQQNGLKMLDPKQAKQLTRQEREEVYRRSLKAIGLTEDGPMTPEQRDLVLRMYRTMVLGESGNRPPN
jgi:protein subunit release factor B